MDFLRVQTHHGADPRPNRAKNFAYCGFTCYFTIPKRLDCRPPGHLRKSLWQALEDFQNYSFSLQHALRHNQWLVRRKPSLLHVTDRLFGWLTHDLLS